MRFTFTLLILIVAVPSTLFAVQDASDAKVGAPEKPAANSEAQEEQESSESEPVGDRPTADDMDEMELIDLVAGLQADLLAQQIDVRDAAEKELERLGPRVLDFLEPEDDTWTTDGQMRLQRLRQKLESLAVAAVTKASRVTMQGKLTLGKAVEWVREKTKNKIQIPEGLPQPFVDQELEFALNNVSFWEATLSIMRQANLEINPYGASEKGALMLTPKSQQVDQDGNPVALEEVAPPSDQAGVFDVQVTQVSSMRSLTKPALSHTNLTLKIRWEPRIQPISLDIPIKELKIIDEFDKPIPVSRPEAVLSAMVQPEIPELEFILPLKLVDRQIENIKSITAKIDTVLPGRMETFKFRNVGQLEPGTEQRKAGAIVTYRGTQKNDDVYGVTINLGFDETSKALESHQSWVYQNDVFLMDADGTRIENLGMESAGADERSISIQYYFEQDPRDYTLVYRTPAAIVEVPVVIVLKKIPLP